MDDINDGVSVNRIIVDHKSGVTYHRGHFLGSGRFAKCYEIKNVATSEIFACKIISKKRLPKEHTNFKLEREIQIHSTMSHKYIVSLHSYFEDKSNMYIILELCRRQTLMEMLSRRRRLTYLEVRYFMRQIFLACKYIHDNKVIHRDLSLKNIFINDCMEIKIGDFGLATRVNYEGEKKQTFCGTPNFTAPEIIFRDGYSYEADIWSLGCIMYALLVGSAPFDAKHSKVIYAKIKNNDYILPPMMDRSAMNLIQKLLSLNPECRPKASEIFEEDFFQIRYVPSRLPSSCLALKPRLAHNITLPEESEVAEMSLRYEKRQARSLTAGSANMEMDTRLVDKANLSQDTILKDFYLRDLLSMVESIIRKEAEIVNKRNYKDAEDPSLAPFVWISQWGDYSAKYGLGYQLCDNSLGFIFNDKTQLILLADGKTLQYVNRNNEEFYCSTKNYPRELKTKISLLRYYKTHLLENLTNAGENAKPQDGDKMMQVPHLRAWFRKKSAIIFYLTNGTCQINFFRNHTNIILCPLMGAVSVIDENKNLTVYNFKLIEKYGCSQVLVAILRYAKEVLEALYDSFIKKTENEMFAGIQ